jgi:hypothetical protein
MVRAVGVENGEDGRGWISFPRGRIARRRGQKIPGPGKLAATDGGGETQNAE